jgi:uncharacterized protein
LSIFVLISLSIIRAFLPLFGSFFVLIITPAIYLTFRKLLGFNGAFGFLLIFVIIVLDTYFLIFNFIQYFYPDLESFVPLFINFFSRYLFPRLSIDTTFPNPLLISLLMGLNVFLFLSVMGSSQVVYSQLDGLARKLDWRRRLSDRFKCEACGGKMERLSTPELENYLSPPQQVALSWESLECFAWRCPDCQSESHLPSIHLRSYVHRKTSRGEDIEFEDCPICQEATWIKRQIVAEEPTWSRKGQKVIRRECAYCDHTEEERISIAVKPLPKNVLLLNPSAMRTDFTFDFVGEVLGELDRPVHCQHCLNEMTLTSSVFCELSLNPKEAIAIQIGSLQVKAFHCEYHGQSPSESHLCFYRCQGDYFKYCPTCEEVTIKIENTTITPATTTSPGRGCRYERCHSCGVYQEAYYEIPKLPEPQSTRRQSSRNSDNDHSSSWNNSDNSSSSDFGGGSSDGGGAGGDW